MRVNKIPGQSIKLVKIPGHSRTNRKIPGFPGPVGTMILAYIGKYLIELMRSNIAIFSILAANIVRFVHFEPLTLKPEFEGKYVLITNLFQNCTPFD